MDARFSKIALIGTPNVGKSSLVNGICNTHIAAVSRKRNTTRHAETLGVLTIKNIQLEFFDTPGMVVDEQIESFDKKWMKRHEMYAVCCMLCEKFQLFETNILKFVACPFLEEE